jgi:HAMP domain-containing protein
VRVPLYLKLMASYLLVVGLVVVPAFFYVRQIQQQDLHDNLEQELRGELASLGDRLATMSPEQRPQVVAELQGLLPHRATLIDPEGRVLADSVSSGPFESHADRPELIAALASSDGFGSASRRSATTGDEYLYAARRFPRSGPAQGVIRLAVSTGAIRATEAKASSFLNRTCAAALTVAVLLSFVAAMVLSRPLKRIAEGARGFAEGDFGHPIDVRTKDELGDVGRALDDLAARLRDRLVSAGADRATLQGLLDELPVGIVVYDKDREPSVVSGPARELCDLDAAHETERVRAIASHADHAPLVAKVLEDGVAREATLALPWRPGVDLRARWVALYGADGARQPGVIVSEGGEAAARRALGRAALALAKAAAAVNDRALATVLLEASDEAAAACVGRPSPEDVEAVSVEALCVRAKAELDALFRDSLALKVTVAGADARVAEANDRTYRAVRALMAAAQSGGARGGTLQVRGEPFDGQLRLTISERVSAEALERVKGFARYLGGDAGSAQEGEPPSAWLQLPRA